MPSMGILLHVSNKRRRTSSDGEVKYSSSASSSSGYLSMTIPPSINDLRKDMDPPCISQYRDKANK